VVFKGWSRRTGAIGIDFGREVIRVLQLHETAGDLRVSGAALVPTLGADLSRESDAADLASRLRDAIRGRGLTGRRCILALPRSCLRMQSVRMPVMPDGELREAVAWEAVQRFGMARERMECDCIRTGVTVPGTESREEIIIVAATHEDLQHRLSVVTSAGLRPQAVDIEIAALARLLSRRHRRGADQNRVRAVIDVGSEGSIFMLVRGDQIAFAKSLHLVGADLRAAVMERLQIDAEAAADLRRQRSTTKADETVERAVYEAVRPLLLELVKEIVLCLRYYGVTMRGQPPERAIITGDEALDPELPSLLSEAAKIEAEFDDSAGTLERLNEDLRRRLARDPGPCGGWAVAAGLSARGMPMPKSAPHEKAQAGKEAA